eukprot:CAMPEP_0175052040 /NCGR_PEP_ID=MMETSP0052_2-20121109/8141_1 /TAXON_ID=51329 ORGANISM="Polytomella parva, Strain SAG 63-3" /NCGR_SAMPLE_ID=MMETSP0052_2 /ASSEMBLY_ACC=CAM_ASM_000194 /LENGTH=907 /DNA_ID=CAMNT_0016316405 /DNA_START=213 /DNA_END=2936 /DNA_ORIENTATION=+
MFKDNLKLFSEKEVSLITSLIEEGQEHVFDHWPELGQMDDKKRSQVDQLNLLDETYPGGLLSYIRNAKRLLKDSLEGRNPFEGFAPEVPMGTHLDFGSDEFRSFETLGLSEASRAAFVLVAGGLGERLGYSGIKLGLPTESASNCTFIECYCRSILAIEAAASTSSVSESADHPTTSTPKPSSTQRIPLVIMTSDDTHCHTERMLEQNAFFGLLPSQVILLKQERVACFTDSAAHLALDPKDPFRLPTKPHGHGDVHALIHASGLPELWAERGIKWVCFFQDTNALLFHPLLAAIGVSARKGWHINSLAVPRRAKEAIGGICKLIRRDRKRMSILSCNGSGSLSNIVVVEDGPQNGCNIDREDSNISNNADTRNGDDGANKPAISISNSTVVDLRGTIAASSAADAENTSPKANVVSAMTLNVEYNQLDPLLRANGWPEGDADDETGFSPFPGNINQIVLSLPQYAAALAVSQGLVGEFANPKYKDGGPSISGSGSSNGGGKSNVVVFKSSARLECMMQDIPKAYPSDAVIGFTVVRQVWTSYSPVKNSALEARAKAKAGAPTHSATDAEMDFYRTQCAALMIVAGAKLLGSGEEKEEEEKGGKNKDEDEKRVESTHENNSDKDVTSHGKDSDKKANHKQHGDNNWEQVLGSNSSILLSETFNEIPVRRAPAIVLSPSFALSLDQLQRKVKFGSITLHPGSVLILDGPEIQVEGPLEVKGALVIRSAPHSKVIVRAMKVENAGWIWDPVDPMEPAPHVPEEYRLRGFRVLRRETEEHEFLDHGVFSLGESEEDLGAPNREEKILDLAMSENATEKAEGGGKIAVIVEVEEAIAQKRKRENESEREGREEEGGLKGGVSAKRKEVAEVVEPKIEKAKVEEAKTEKRGEKSKEEAKLEEDALHTMMFFV